MRALQLSWMGIALRSKMKRFLTYSIYERKFT